MNNYSRLFQLTGDKKLKKLEENPFERETKITEFIHNNFSEIFSSDLILFTDLNENFSLKYVDVRKAPKKVDDLAFNEKQNTFYVFEYKNVAYGKLIQQVETYRTLLKHNIDTNRQKVRERYAHYWKTKGKRKKLDHKKFDWRNTKVVCISPYFDNIQSSKFIDKNILLVKLTKFEGGIIRFESEHEWLFIKERKRSKTQKENNLNEKETTSFKEIIEKKKGWKDETKEIEELINESFNNSVEIKEIWEKKSDDWISCKKNNRAILLIRIRQKELLIRMKSNEATKNLPPCHHIHYKELNRKIEIKDKEDFKKAFEILENYLEEIKKE
jgi:hypothetical protein